MLRRDNSKGDSFSLALNVLPEYARQTAPAPVLYRPHSWRKRLFYSLAVIIFLLVE